MTISETRLTSTITPIEDLYTTPQRIVVKVEPPVEKTILLSNAVEEIQVESAGTGLTVLKVVGVALTLFGVIAALVGNHALLNTYHLTLGTVVVAPIHLIVTGLALALLGLSLIYFSYPKPTLDVNPDSQEGKLTQTTKSGTQVPTQELDLAAKNKILEAEVSRLLAQNDFYGKDFWGTVTPNGQKNTRANDDLSAAVMGVTPYRKQHIVQQKQLQGVELRSKDLLQKPKAASKSEKSQNSASETQIKVEVAAAPNAPTLQPKEKKRRKKEKVKVEEVQAKEKPMIRPRSNSVITFDQELQAKIAHRKK